MFDAGGSDSNGGCAEDLSQSHGHTVATGRCLRPRTAVPRTLTYTAFCQGWGAGVTSSSVPAVISHADKAGMAELTHSGTVPNSAAELLLSAVRDAGIGQPKVYVATEPGIEKVERSLEDLAQASRSRGNAYFTASMGNGEMKRLLGVLEHALQWKDNPWLATFGSTSHSVFGADGNASVSGLHRDLCDCVLIVVSGSKKIRLARKSAIKPHNEFSAAEVENLRAAEGETLWSPVHAASEVHLSPGMSLFIPSEVWHDVVSEPGTLALSIKLVRPGMGQDVRLAVVAAQGAALPMPQVGTKVLYFFGEVPYIGIVTDILHPHSDDVDRRTWFKIKYTDNDGHDLTLDQTHAAMRAYDEREAKGLGYVRDFDKAMVYQLANLLRDVASVFVYGLETADGRKLRHGITLPSAVALLQAQATVVPVARLLDWWACAPSTAVAGQASTVAAGGCGSKRKRAVSPAAATAGPRRKRRRRKGLCRLLRRLVLWREGISGWASSTLTESLEFAKVVDTGVFVTDVGDLETVVEAATPGGSLEHWWVKVRRSMLRRLLQEKKLYMVLQGLLALQKLALDCIGEVPPVTGTVGGAVALRVAVPAANGGQPGSGTGVVADAGGLAAVAGDLPLLKDPQLHRVRAMMILGLTGVPPDVWPKNCPMQRSFMFACLRHKLPLLQQEARLAALAGGVNGRQELQRVLLAGANASTAEAERRRLEQIRAIGQSQFNVQCHGGHGSALQSWRKYAERNHGTHGIKGPSDVLGALDSCMRAVDAAADQKLSLKQGRIGPCLQGQKNFRDLLMGRRGWERSREKPPGFPKVAAEPMNWQGMPFAGSARDGYVAKTMTRQMFYHETVTDSKCWEWTLADLSEVHPDRNNALPMVARELEPERPVKETMEKITVLEASHRLGLDIFRVCCDVCLGKTLGPLSSAQIAYLHQRQGIYQHAHGIRASQGVYPRWLREFASWRTQKRRPLTAVEAAATSGLAVLRLPSFNGGIIN